VARVHGAGAARVRSAQPALDGPASACWARDDAAHAGAVTAPRCTSRRGRRRRHSGGGGANGGGRAPTTVRLPDGHGGGVDSSPELLVDGEGKKFGSAATFFLTRWGYGGRRRSYDGEEGGEGELDAPRKRNGERKAQATLTVDETCDDGGRPDSDGIQTRRRCGFRHRRWRGRDGVR
jgi:hypothetical protein